MRGDTGGLANEAYSSNPIDLRNNSVAFWKLQTVIEIIGDDIHVTPTDVDFHVSIPPTLSKYSLRRNVLPRSVFSVPFSQDYDIHLPG